MRRHTCTNDSYAKQFGQLQESISFIVYNALIITLIKVNQLKTLPEK